MIFFQKTSALLFLSSLFVLANISNAVAEMEGLKPKSGVYNKVQVVPNFFTTFCGYGADELVDNPENRNHCIHKLGVYLNPNNAQTKVENAQNYEQNVKADSIRILTALTVAKNASISDLREGVAEMAKMSTDSTTTHDDSKGHVLALSKYSDSLNSLRELMAESTLLEVIDNIPKIDRDVAIEVAQNQSNIVDNSLEETATSSTVSGSTKQSNDNKVTGKNGATRTNSSSSSSHMKEYTSDNPYLGKWMWVEDNACTRAVCTGKGDTEASLNCTYERENCPDGAYSTNVANKIVSCEGGKCEVLSTRDEDICGNKSLVLITKLKFAYQSGNQPAVCTNGQTFTLCPDGKYRISGTFYHACLNGKCVECLSND